ncbi:hypothetical protein P6P90_00200 [Ectobacillus antri]|jgi:hypothetical protein|uniref:Uncharacterized protein n=1 Tax=Ectobacillus antri TaxID=2486280 RepID=A0ABT6H1C2_9BACI|nr:hypothetical protein [Ectobacillus antri]MDG4655745.1 hypothetical protein [Ectobacillus antri]MDG5752420.1 hypothetical protein [Ectobacillus antri]
MENMTKFFLAAFVGWLWTMTAGTIDSSLTSFFHFFNITALDGFIDFLKYMVIFIGWFAVAFFGWRVLSDAWKQD